MSEQVYVWVCVGVGGCGCACVCLFVDVSGLHLVMSDTIFTEKLRDLFWEVFLFISFHPPDFT